MDFTGWKTHRKAEYAMAKVQERAISIGAHVFLPTREGLPFDCVVEWEGTLRRVQVKFSAGCDFRSGAPVIRSSSNGKKYRVGEVDAFAVYLPLEDEVVWITFEETLGRGRINVNPSFIASHLWN